MDDRGAHETRRLPGDYSVTMIVGALEAMFEAFMRTGGSGRLAVIVQPLVKEGALGHLSNERRVSKTVNQWQWEKLSPTPDEGRLNSQRDQSPDPLSPLSVSVRRKDLARKFGAVGHWIVDLRKGPAHLEWAHDGQHLWLLQLDFELERPDEGVNPEEWLREIDVRPPGVLPADSPFESVDLQAPPGSWRKIENVKRFAVGRADRYPTLITLPGDRFFIALAEHATLSASLDAFAHGRIVCRTDCKADGIARENLPRTNTVTADAAVEQMRSFLVTMQERGAAPEDVCFIAHKFIPAVAGAWARADPTLTAVRVDCLWGVPDGLQYLPHDSFEYDVARQKIVSERIRWKPRFIQECDDGTWKELTVRRSLARTRSLRSVDVEEIAATSHAIASRSGKAMLIMWFCGIPPELGIGRNLPWFSMPTAAVARALRGDQPISPQWSRTVLRTSADVTNARERGLARTILVLDPEIDLFRDDKHFLSAVIELAKTTRAPVQVAGSILAHAYYQLEKAGVSVVAADEAGWSRVRGRRSFDKLVRDRIPAEIAARGEAVIGSQLQRSELRRALAAKLLEEIQELLTATDPDEVKAELADLLEVVRAIAGVTGVEWKEVELAAHDKRERRGGFETGAILVETAWRGSERTPQRAPPMMTLRGLGKVAVAGGRGKLSYNSLVASDGTGVTVDLEGQRITVRLVRDGISLETQGRAGPHSSAQLSLPLDEVEGL